MTHCLLFINRGKGAAFANPGEGKGTGTDVSIATKVPDATGVTVGGRAGKGGGGNGVLTPSL